jgi:creatinine amidohydrolase
MATSAIPDIETRDRMAEEGLVLLNKMVDAIDFPTLLKEMAIQEDYLEEVYKRYPHVPAAYNRHKNI